jgi:hypothetical protein
VQTLVVVKPASVLEKLSILLKKLPQMAEKLPLIPKKIPQMATKLLLILEKVREMSGKLPPISENPALNLEKLSFLLKKISLFTIQAASGWHRRHGFSRSVRVPTSQESGDARKRRMAANPSGVFLS